MTETAQRPRAAGKAAGEPPRTVSSGELLAGQRQLIIRHGTDEYRLQITSSNKLILTK